MTVAERPRFRLLPFFALTYLVPWSAPLAASLTGETALPVSL